MSDKRLLGLELHTLSKNLILDKIKKDSKNLHSFYHIVSINPEIVILTRKIPLFKKVVETAQIQIMDGIGTVLASKMLNLSLASRLAGVDLMQELLSMAGKERLTVMLIGGKGNLAKTIADCYNRLQPKAKYIGIEGIKNITKPTKSEEKAIFSIVSDMKPRILLVAFGSPQQELWLWENRLRLSGIICMGVGGGFDYLAGKINRAPLFIRKIGLEWLYRLLRQPWRWRRQLRLIEFSYLVLRQRLSSI